MAVNCTSSMRVGLSGLQFSDKQLLASQKHSHKKTNTMLWLLNSFKKKNIYKQQSEKRKKEKNTVAIFVQIVKVDMGRFWCVCAEEV